MAIVVLAAACGHNPWPDEPGVPVEVSLTTNVEVGERFLSALTSRRQAAGLTPPVTASRYQEELRAYATDLQAGKISAAQAQQTIATWGRTRYGTEVASFVLDCSTGSNMPIPNRVVELPTAVISYAAAHFRPRSLPHEQCALLLVAVVGSEQVKPIAP